MSMEHMEAILLDVLVLLGKNIPLGCLHYVHLLFSTMVKEYFRLTFGVSLSRT
uniref:Uncharacterized protein n=1 Tax=Rhizophora mucronata TaxID=61149 RepID=A0A2P2MN61_RHIMU